MASTSVMYPNGTIHLTDMTNKYKWEPQRTNHFEVFVQGLGGNELALAVSVFSLPNITNEPIQVYHGNSRIHFAGQADFTGSETLEVVDFIGLDVELMIYEWRKAVYNPEDDIMGLAADYKKSATVVEYSPDNKVLRTWKLTGLWPSGVAFGDTLSYEGSDVKKMSMTMSYDRAVREKA